MNSTIYTFDLPNPLNLEALDVEISASTIQYANYIGVSAVGGRLHVSCNTELIADDYSTLINIVASHTGAKSRTTRELKDKRGLVLDKMVSMSHAHPLLNNDDVSSYLTSIDNWFNCWVRDGNASNLTDKISADAQNGEPYSAFLNTDLNGQGLLAYMFLISMIPTDPYLGE